MAVKQGGEPGGAYALVDEAHALAVVADGSGGPAGAAAAKAAATAALAAAAGDGALEAVFDTARRQAVDALGSEGAGAGASLAVARIDAAGTLELAHVGNVRTYLLRPQGGRALPEPAAPKLCPPLTGKSAALVCLSRDHSTVCDMVERGHLGPRDARRHPLRARLTRGLRVEEPGTPDRVRIGLYPGDRLLVCSSGVWDKLDDEEILKGLETYRLAAPACDGLGRTLGLAAPTRSFGMVVVDCFPESTRDEPAVEAAERRPSAPRDGHKPPANQERRPPPSPPGDGRKRGAEELSPAEFLERFGRDITALARAGKLDSVIGREREIHELAQALVARRKANAVLIGPPGVGKTAIVEGVAVEMAAGRLGESFTEMRIVEIAMGAIVAGTQYRGMFEERMLNVVRAAEADPKLVIFIDELHTAMGAGSSRGSESDAADLLKPALARGTMRLIGATTTEEYQKFIERDAAFARRLTVIDVAEPSVEHTIAILRGLRPSFEKHYRVDIDDDAFDAAAKLSARYVVGRFLPDKAIDLVDRGCARLLVPMGGAGEGGRRLTRRHIVELVADMCAVDVELIGRDLHEARERVAELEGYLRSRIFGQDGALAAIARQIQRAYGGLKDPKRPVASFLFVGPTGVGKTETAKVVAEFLFHDRERVLRIDMSEYHDRWAISRLIGAPPGYIGSDEEGQLTGPMHRHSARVVLFDEIEKAHPDVLLVLLQILDEGRLTDSRGRTASFHEAVVIMTSNLLQQGLAEAPRRIGFGPDDAPSAPTDAERASAEQDALREELARELRPELVGRIGAVVQFRPLSRAAARAIVEARAKIALSRLQAHGATLELPAAFVDDVLAELGDLRFGARMIERLVDDAVGRLLDQAAPLGGGAYRTTSEPGARGVGRPPVSGAAPAARPAPPGTPARASMSARASLRADVAMLALLPSAPLEESAVRALVTSLYLGPHAAQVREVDARSDRIVVLAATLPAALGMAARVGAAQGIALRRLVHRGRVQLGPNGQVQGVGLYVLDQVAHALAGSDEAAARVVMTSAAYDALEPEQRSGFVRLPCEPLEAIGSDLHLWVEREAKTP